MRELKHLNLALLEKLFTVVSLFLYSGGLLDLVLSGGKRQQNVTVEYDSSLILATFMILYVITGVLLLLRWREVLFSLKRDYVVIPILILVFLSYFWSEAPDVTLKRSIATLGTSLFGIYLASRYSIRQQLELLAWSFALVIFLSMAFVLALPSYGLAQGLHEGAWRGIFPHKNGLGMNMALSSAVFLLLMLSTGKKKRAFLFGFLASSFLLLMAQSGTALASLLGILLCLMICKLVLGIRSSVRLVPVTLALILGVIGLALVVANNSEFVLAALGEDATLTGRTEFWPYVVESIRRKPLLGYGFEGFWRGLAGASSYVYYAGPAQPSHAHNGLLQLWLSLGFVGVSVFLIGYWSSLLRSFAYVRFNPSSGEHYWPISYLTLIFLINVAESNLVEYNDLNWVLYCAVVVSLSKFFSVRRTSFSGVRSLV